MKIKAFFLLASLCTLFALTSVSNAAVIRSVTVETSNVESYAKEIAVASDIMKRAGSEGVIRVWVGRYAGESAGSVVVTVEYPDMASLARDYETMRTNEEFGAWLKKLSGLRTIVSDSIYQEVTK